MGQGEVRLMDLRDAKALLDRAKRHYGELRHLSDGQHLWHVRERQLEAGYWSYEISVDRGRLVAAGPVVADCANNISSALDHVAAAIAKSRNSERLTDLYFPWAFEDDEFKRKLAKTEKTLGIEMTAAIAGARDKHRNEVHHVEAVKQISRDGKHWELRTASGSAHGVGLILPNFGQQLFQVPSTLFQQVDTYEFHRGTNKLDASKGWQIIVGLKIEGLSDGLPTSPDSIFPCAFRYVQGTMDIVEQAAA